MNKYLLPMVAAVTFALPTAASAQALPAAVVAVVDIQRATTSCNACKTALNQLEVQVNSLKALQTSLENSLRTEATSIQTAVNALAGKQPDAALTARVQAFEKKQADSQRQLQTREQTFQRNRAYVLQQIGQKLGPIYQQVMQRHSATVLLEQGNTLAASASIDVTAEVTAALNAALPSVQTTAPAAPAQQQPQSR